MEGFIEVLREMEIRVGFVCWFNASRLAEEYFRPPDMAKVLKEQILIECLNLKLYQERQALFLLLLKSSKYILVCALPSGGKSDLVAPSGFCGHRVVLSGGTCQVFTFPSSLPH